MTGRALADRRGLLVCGPSPTDAPDPVFDHTVPAVLLRAPDLVWPEIVHVYRVTAPTVAFSARDLRSPQIASATRLARAAGFETVVRSPGGRMVAYDAGAVVIDHVTQSDGTVLTGPAIFAAQATGNRRVLGALGVPDVRIGPVDGEYCPGEFSINVAGVAKVVGSAQRVAGRAGLFSTVIQVDMSERVRLVIEEVSAALRYQLRPSSIAGLTDFAPGLTTGAVADAFQEDYRSRLNLFKGHLPAGVAEHVARARAAVRVDSALPFQVDAWARNYPLPPCAANA